MISDEDNDPVISDDDGLRWTAVQKLLVLESISITLGHNQNQPKSNQSQNQPYASSSGKRRSMDEDKEQEIEFEGNTLRCEDDLDENF